MLGMVTTVMMHFPVGSVIDAMFFILKGYQLDGPPRRHETRQSIAVGRNVTLYMLGEIFLLSILGLVWLFDLFNKKRH